MSPDRDDRSGAPDPDVDALFAQIVAGWDSDETSPVPPWPASEDLPDRTTGPAARRDRSERRTDRVDPADRGDASDRAERHEPTDRTGPADRTMPTDRRQPAERSDPDAGEPSAPPRAAAPAPEHAPDPAGPQTPDRAGDGAGDRTGDRPPAAGDARPALPGPPAPGPRDWAATDEPDEGYVPPEPPPLPRGDLVGRLAWAGVLLGPAFLLLSALVWDDAGPLPLAVAALAFVGGFVTLVSRLPARREDDDDDGAVV